MISRPSPNFNARDPRHPLSLVIVHFTGMRNAPDALERLCDPSAEVSAHYMIDKDGTLFALVDEMDRAWHAGKSFWQGIRDVNSASLGIELVNTGQGETYPAPQIQALKELLGAIYARYAFPPEALQGHSDVAPRRKDDPGVLFPWKELAAEGFGLWPNVLEKDFAPIKQGEAEECLAALGYEALLEPDILIAFQRHYRPSLLNGDLDAETMALLRALRRQISEQDGLA